MAKTKHLVVVDGREIDCGTPEGQFETYKRLVPKYVSGDIQQLEAMDITHRYGREDVSNIIILIDGEPDDWRY